MRGPPTATSRPATEARAPRPASASKDSAPTRARPRSSAARTTARASGCSESASTAAASDQELVLVDAGRGSDRRQCRLTARQGAGLVEDDDVQLAGPFERQAVLHEQAVTSAQAGGDGDDERDGEPQGMGAGDDEDGRRAHEGLLEVPVEPPPGEGDDAGGDGHVEEEGRSTVRERLGA